MTKATRVYKAVIQKKAKTKQKTQRSLLEMHTYLFTDKMTLCPKYAL